MSTVRFAVGDRVRVKEECPGGNPRTPPYARGRIGTVIAYHGTIENPLDHRDVYPPLYSVEFTLGDVGGAEPAATVVADIHDEWLEPAPAENEGGETCGS